MGLFLLGVPRDAVGEDQECRGPKTNEDPEQFAMGAHFKRSFFPARIIPDGYGCEDLGEAKEKTEVAEEFHKGSC